MDTHTFLWSASSLADVARLGKFARNAIEDPESVLFVSPVSLFELSNKYRAGKLQEYKPVVENLLEALNGLEAEELPVKWEHANLAGNLDWVHKDPFDRILAAQAIIEGMAFITCDKAFENAPGLSIVW